MRCLRRSLRNIVLGGVVLLECIALAACGDECFSGVINNPNGVIITTKNPMRPTCPPSTIITTMNVAVVKSQPCVGCTPAVRAEHIFVTIKNIQLHSTSSEWIDLAPQLRPHPRQIDLAGDSSTLMLVQNALIPADTYREVRLQFAPDTSTSSDDAVATETSCGQNRGNCMLMADSHVEQFHFLGDPPELLMPLQMNGSSLLAVVPGTTLDLHLTLQPQQVSSVSLSEGWQVHYALVGSASVSR